jgi:hypothetical protein
MKPVLFEHSRSLHLNSGTRYREQPFSLTVVS